MGLVSNSGIIYPLDTIPKQDLLHCLEPSSLIWIIPSVNSLLIRDDSSINSPGRVGFSPRSFKVSSLDDSQ